MEERRGGFSPEKLGRQDAYRAAQHAAAQRRTERRRDYTQAERAPLGYRRPGKSKKLKRGMGE